MNPATGNFLTIDTYEGSIYDPDTLHKYMYANGNPVTYSDPSGNVALSLGDLSIAGGINSVLQHQTEIYWMGVLSGIVNSSVTAIMGGSLEECGVAFLEGFIRGCFLGAIQYFAIGIELVTLAEFFFIQASASTCMMIVLTIASVCEGNMKQAVIYGSLSLLFLFSTCHSYNMMCSAEISGPKGLQGLELDNSNPDQMTIRGAKNLLQLPQYDGTTQGVLLLEDGTQIKFSSGKGNPNYVNYANNGHVEQKAAMYMNENNINNAILYHNNTNGTCGWCNNMTSTFLEEGATLTIVPPENAVANNSRAVIVIKTYTGNDKIPKIKK